MAVRATHRRCRATLRLLVPLVVLAAAGAAWAQGQGPELGGERPALVPGIAETQAGDPAGAPPMPEPAIDLGPAVSTARPAATTSPAQTGACASAIGNAAIRHGVPLDLMLAIGQVESGLNPWVINAAGQGIRFDSLGEAVQGVQQLRGRGVTSIDVGCMQVNLHWHPDAFQSLSEAFVPSTNADYAARFLRTLFRDTGSWETAMTRYHSGDPMRQRRYGCAVRGELARLRGDTAPACDVTGPQVQTAASVFAPGAAVLPPRSFVDGAVVLVGRGSVAPADDRVITGDRIDDRVVSPRP